MAVNNGLRVWVVLKQNREELRQPTMVGTWLTAAHRRKGQDGTGTHASSGNPRAGTRGEYRESCGSRRRALFQSVGPYLIPP